MTGHLVPSGTGEVTVKCPIPSHEDKKPSASLNLTDNVWVCYTCGVGGSQVDLLMYSAGMERNRAIEYLKDEII